MRAQIFRTVRIHASKRKLLIAARNIVRQRHRPPRKILDQIEPGVGRNNVTVGRATEERRPQRMRRFDGLEGKPQCALPHTTCLAISTTL